MREKDSEGVRRESSSQEGEGVQRKEGWGGGSESREQEIMSELMVLTFAGNTGWHSVGTQSPQQFRGEAQGTHLQEGVSYPSAAVYSTH